MSVSIKNNSRLQFADLLSVDGIECWDICNLPDAVPRQDDSSYVVQDQDRIDLLAQRFYQDPVYWWVIAWANSLDILPTDLKPGMTLRIPSPAYVASIIRDASRNA